MGVLGVGRLCREEDFNLLGKVGASSVFDSTNIIMVYYSKTRTQLPN